MISVPDDIAAVPPRHFWMTKLANRMPRVGPLDRLYWKLHEWGYGSPEWRIKEFNRLSRGNMCPACGSTMERGHACNAY